MITVLEWKGWGTEKWGCYLNDFSVQREGGYVFISVDLIYLNPVDCEWKYPTVYWEQLLYSLIHFHVCVKCATIQYLKLLNDKQKYSINIIV